MSDNTAAHAVAPPATPGRWRRFLVFVVAFTIIAAGGAVYVFTNTTTLGAQATPNEPAAQAAVAAIEAQGSPESVVATFREGEVTESVDVGGHGNTPQTPFYIGSASKTFTALIAARLADRGELDLDDPVIDHLPWFTVGGEGDDVTVRHLLNQTSGLPTAAGIVDITTPTVTLEERVRALEDQELEGEPGQAFRYSNKNFAVLGLVLQEVTGQDYEQLLEKEVAEPLGLQHTGARPPDGGRDVRSGHLAAFGSPLPWRIPHFPGALPDGYLVSSAADLALVADVLATGAHEGERYFSEDMYREVTTPPEAVGPDPDYDTRYGFGLRVSDAGGWQMLWHEGELANLHTNVGVLPDDRTGVIVLTTQYGQLYDADTPFLGAMDALAAGDGVTGTPEEDPSGGYRAIAYSMVVVAALVLALMVADLWPAAPGRRAPTRRFRVATGILRFLGGAGLMPAVLYALGASLGMDGPMPPRMAWEAATDLTAILLLVSVYLVLSGILRTARGMAKP